MTRHAETPYECIEPEIGDQIWRIGQEDVEPELRRRLEAHVAACDACRLALDLDERARRLFRAGELTIGDAPGDADKVTPLRAAALVAAALALAAALACLLLLPPRPADRSILHRGDHEPGFTRPVEGEVIRPGAARLAWDAIPGAARYEVRISDDKGDVVWQGLSEATALEVPDDAALRAGGRYKALLAVQPADLMPPGRMSVTFSAGDAGRVALHRLRFVNLWSLGLGLAALALSFTGIRIRE